MSHLTKNLIGKNALMLVLSDQETEQEYGAIREELH